MNPGTVNPGRIGFQGESTAISYLKGIGAEILATNYTAAGAEIDIIARLDGVTVFVEVKRRSSVRYGRPGAAVTPGKQQRILRAASVYLSRNGGTEQPARFDVIEVLPGAVNHIRGAFDASRPSSGFRGRY